MLPAFGKQTAALPSPASLGSGPSPAVRERGKWGVTLSGTSSASEDAGGAHGEGQQKEAEGNGGGPGGAVEGRGDAFDDADQHGTGEHPGKARHPAEHADREDPPDIVAADRGLDRLDDDQESAGDRGCRDRDAEGDAFDPA